MIIKSRSSMWTLVTNGIQFDYVHKSILASFSFMDEIDNSNDEYNKTK